MDKMQILKNQFVFNAKQNIKARERKDIKTHKKREAVSLNMRNIAKSLWWKMSSK
ncbi:TPA: hypothetical protein R9128_001694 [Campylobacter upsaliensis]|nr:hypothetical protein [Campylobacter upsaliensis]